MPTELSGSDVTFDDDPETFYKFSSQYMKCLFPSTDFPKLSIHSSGAEMEQTMEQNDSKEIHIVVSDSLPNSACLTVNNKTYKAKVVMGITAGGEGSPDRPSKFRVDRFARHGGGFNEWWYQDRTNGNQSRQIMTQYMFPPDMQRNLDNSLFPSEPCLGNSVGLPRNCFCFVTVFVKLGQSRADEFKIAMHRSVGGQTVVFCDCCENNSLIVTGRRKENKR